MMRYAEAAVSLNRIDEALVVVTPLGVLPALYLSACALRPFVANEAEFPKSGRLSGMTYYYSGFNRLLLRHFDVSRSQLYRAITCKSCGDFLSEITVTFGLSCFLTHLNLKQFRSLVPFRAEISFETLKLWDFEASLDEAPSLFGLLMDEIFLERRRQKILMFSQTVSKMSIEYLVEKLRLSDFSEAESLLVELLQAKCINYRLVDGIIEFAAPDFSDRIHAEREILAQLRIPQ
jgi:hypothetical protein